MIRPKKVLKEDTNESADNDKTSAQTSLHPAARSEDDPKSMTHKSAILAKMIGASLAMDEKDLLKHFNSMMAYHDKVGHGMGVGNVSDSNKNTLDMSPSAATKLHSYGDVKNPMPHLKDNVKEAIKADVDTMLEGQEGLSEEFKTQAATLFEAAVEARVAAIQLELTEAAEKSVEDQVNEIGTSLVEGLDKYLDYVGNEWMKENEVAIESSLRNEIASDFIKKLGNLFVESNFNIPEDQVDVVDTMAQRIDDLEGRLNNAISENTDLSDALVTYQKGEIIKKLSEGLTMTEAEKLTKLAENVDAEDVDEYIKKVTTIKESNFVKGKGTGTAKKSVINETMEEVNEDNKTDDEPKKFGSPQMNRYAAAISRTIQK